ncbi:MAG: TonB-dependent receptor plug domain-containing protein [Bacteroidales bacterium]
MEKQLQHSSHAFTFRRWARKSYAAFNSLGKQIRIGVLYVGCSILTVPALAQVHPDSIRVIEVQAEHELDEVVISAQHVPAVSSELMRSVQVISRSEIERSPASDLASLLESVRGVDIRKRGSFGIQADISIRGGTFDQTLILLNGINISDPQTGHHHLNIPVDLESIERIEVLHGSGARVFGPNAFNGAINIITRKPDHHGVRLSLSGGGHGLAGGSLTAGIKGRRLSHHFAFSGLRSDGYVSNTDFQKRNFFYRTQADVGGARLDIQGGYNRKSFGANSFYSPVFPEQFEATRTKYASMQLTPEVYPSVKVQAYWRRHHDRFELFRHEAPEWYNGHNFHLSDAGGVNIHHLYLSDMGKTAMAVDLRYEQIFSNVLGEPMDEPIGVTGQENTSFTHHHHRTGISIMAEHNVYLGDFSLSAGMLAYANTDLDQKVSVFPGLDAGWQLHPRHRWFASVSRTLRLPTFTDLFYEGPVNQGNPDLLPEEAVFAETGMHSRWGNIDAELVLFRRWGRNMIDWVRYPGDELWYSSNHTRVNLYGFEGGLQVPLSVFSDGLDNGNQTTSRQYLTLEYAYTHAGKQSGEMVSNYALDHLTHDFKAGLHHRAGRNLFFTWHASWKERAGGFLPYEDGEYRNWRKFPSFWMLDARTTYNFSQFEVYAEVSNLLNTHYVDHANVPQPGRWLRLGVVFDTFAQ